MESIGFSGCRISTLLFVDGVILLSSSSPDLLLTLSRFKGEYEAARMKIRTSEFKVQLLSQKTAAPSGGIKVSWDLVHE